MTSQPQAYIDCAGASIGGAARFLRELDTWLTAEQPPVSVVGRERSLTSSWMVRRELEVDRRVRRISLNNVSMVTPGGPRIVLLRNALHFATSAEMTALSFTPSRSLRAQIPVVRTTARMADVVVVPCTAMADRVVRHVPQLGGRIQVRFHPLAPRPWSTQAATSQTLLLPVINSPYKRLQWHLENVVRACRGTAVSEVAVTASASDVSPDLATHPLLNFIGELSSQELDRHFARAAAVYFPTQLESYGYPLAEARANGRRVVALNTSQNREIAGSALVAFELGDEDSLRGALHEAVQSPRGADPKPFDPGAYFSWLVNQ